MRNGMVWLLALAACAGGEKEEASPAAEEGSLLISQLYYSGAPPSGGTDHYYSDQFLELVNDSPAAMDLSGVMIGEVYGIAGEINSGITPDSFRTSNPEEVVMSTVWRIPDGVTLEPGAHLVIAHDGVNHRPFSTIDLSGAQLEAFVAGGNDEDSPTVANLEEVAYNGGYDWLLTVFGPSIVVVEAGTELGKQKSDFGQLKTAPVSSVIDAVETLMNKGSKKFKRLPDSVDAGHIWVSDTYSGESIHRRQEGGAWVDTNNSGNDFEVGEPIPQLGLTEGGVTGTPTVELGTGTGSFDALGDTIELIAGPQGGWHVDVTLRASGFDPDGALVTYEAFDSDGASVSYTTEATLFANSVLETESGWDRVGDRVVLDIGAAEDVVGTDISVRVSVSLGGETWDDEKTVTVD